VDDPIHRDFREAGGAAILRLTYERAEGEPDALTLTFRQRDGRLRRVRSTNPTDLRVQAPFPAVGWLLVLDVSQRQLDGLSLLVTDGEMSEALSFYARAAEELAAI